MRILIAVIPSLLLLSCGSRSLAPPAQESKKALPAGLLVVDGEAQRKAGIVIEEVQMRSVAETITVPGHLTVNEDRTWRVGAIADGKIDDLPAKVGDSVKAGQILARIHSHDVHEARAGYAQAAVELTRSRAAHAYATRTSERTRRLFELKAGSRQDVDTAEAEMRNAQAQIDRAQAELEKERTHLEFLHVSLEDPGHGETQHSPDHDDVPVGAPASGLLLERKASVGSVVTAGQEMFVLTDPASLWMIAAANESDLAKLSPGQPVRVAVLAYPEKEFRGTILKLGEQLNPTTRTLQIRILVPNPQNLLKPEMFATASLAQTGTRPALFVPESAVQDIGGVPCVFVRRAEGQFEPLPVKTGRRVNAELEITEGLNRGDAVVVKGAFLLKSQILKSTLAEE